MPTDFLTDPISQTRAGENGSWFGITPNEAKAFATALAISPPTGIIAPSPAPLAHLAHGKRRWVSAGDSATAVG